MALALPPLALPLPLQSRFCLRFSKFNPSIKSSLSSKSCTHLNRAAQIILQFAPHFCSLTTQASSSLTATAATEEEEEEGVEIRDRRRLIAQNIPWTCTAEDIRALFEKHGTVLDVELSMHKKTRNRGLAFITMASEEEANVALNTFESYDMDGRKIRIAYARPLKKKALAERQVPIQRYTMYVGNLAWRVTSEDLLQLFSSSGEIISARIIYQTKPRRPAGYGFVSFASSEEAEAAISAFNGQEFMERPLNLELSKQQAEVTEGVTDEVEESEEASNEIYLNGEV